MSGFKMTFGWLTLLSFFLVISKVVLSGPVPADVAVIFTASASDSIDPSDTDAIHIALAELFAGVRTVLPLNYPDIFGPEILMQLLQDHPCARMIAKNSKALIFSDLKYFLDLEEISDAFFEELPVFTCGSGNAIYDSLHQFPTGFVEKALKVQSSRKMIVLEDFHAKFDKFCPDFQSNPVSSTFLLPHLLPSRLPLAQIWNNFRGQSPIIPSFDSKNYLIWNISLQLLMVQSGDDGIHIDPMLLPQLKGQLGHLDLEISSVDFFRFSELKDTPSVDFNFNLFGTETPITLESSGSTLAQVAESVGFNDFLSMSYANLSSEQRIIYRLIIYVALFNPSIVKKSDRFKLVKKMYFESTHKDFSVHERGVFISALLRFGCSDEIAVIINSKRNACQIKFELLRHISSSEDRFGTLISNLSSASNQISFLTTLDINNNSDLTIAGLVNHFELVNEKFYYQRQSNRSREMTFIASSAAPELLLDAASSEEAPRAVFGKPISALKRTQRAIGKKPVPRAPIETHFLSSKQFESIPLDKKDKIQSTFTLPFPDKQYVERRLDNMLQNLNSADLGEESWKARLEKLDEETRAQEVEHESTLIAFVKEATIAIYTMQHSYNHDFINLLLVDSPSFGIGLKKEVIDMYARLIILPVFKVFFYDSKMCGFMPYPLLISDMMGLLGYVYNLCIKFDITANFHLAPEFMKFLFYEENPNEDIKELLKKFFRTVYTNIESLNSPSINPIDCFPTVLHSHQPLKFVNDETNLQIDLLSPVATGQTMHASLETYLTKERRELLDTQFTLKRPRDAEEEAKIEAEKEAQAEIKRKIIAVLLHLSNELITENLLVGRFKFQRNFLLAFNRFSLPHLTADLISQSIEEKSVEVTAKDFLDGGFEYLTSLANENVLRINVESEPGLILTPRECFIRMIKTLAPRQLKVFYWFSTGCSSYPISGLNLNPIKISINVNSHLLPTAATCFRTFYFYAFPTFERNLANLHKALTECSGFFKFEGLVQRGLQSGLDQVITATLPDDLLAENGPVPMNMDVLQDGSQIEHYSDSEDDNEGIFPNNQGAVAMNFGNHHHGVDSLQDAQEEYFGDEIEEEETEEDIN